MAVELIAPISGLVGVMIGVAASQIGALAASRRNWNTEEIRTQRDFHVEVLAAANDQLILFANIADRLKGRVSDIQKQLAQGVSLSEVDVHYRHDEEHLARLKSATEKWRTTFAKSVVYAGPEMHSVLSDLDDRRAEVIEALNTFNADSIEPSIDDFEKTLERFHSALRRKTIEANLVLNESFLPWPRSLGSRKKLMKELRDLEKAQSNDRSDSARDERR